MTIRKLTAVVVALGSVLLGGRLGASALDQANAAPLTRTTHAVDR